MTRIRASGFGVYSPGGSGTVSWRWYSGKVMWRGGWRCYQDLLIITLMAACMRRSRDGDLPPDFLELHGRG